VTGQELKDRVASRGSRDPEKFDLLYQDSSSDIMMIKKLDPDKTLRTLCKFPDSARAELCVELAPRLTLQQGFVDVIKLEHCTSTPGY